ncbi:MAG: hypothetical protein WB421_17320 [Terriglobales bacterium]|jgi:hypothetical protein
MAVKKPAIIDLSQEERRVIVNELTKELSNEQHKTLVIEALQFIEKLIEDLKASRISLQQLKERLLGFKAEQRKKALQPQ